MTRSKKASLLVVATALKELTLSKQTLSGEASLLVVAKALKELTLLKQALTKEVILSPAGFWFCSIGVWFLT